MVLNKFNCRKCGNSYRNKKQADYCCQEPFNYKEKNGNIISYGKLSKHKREEQIKEILKDKQTNNLAKGEQP